MTIPHKFPSMIEGATQVVLIAGAGLSAPDLMMVNGLKDKLDEVSRDLGVTPIEDFYELAEVVLEKLENDKKMTKPQSHLWLAEKLGILDDRRWFGKIGLPLSGNTPRHRAIARFASENRLKAIISLNWDTLLETALDSVGLHEDTSTQRPWPITAHVRVIEDSHTRRLTANVFPVIKPHGCVRNITEVRRAFRVAGAISPFTFKLSKSELAALSGGQSLVDKKVEIYTLECPLIAIGWKADEDYLRNTIIKVANALERKDIEVDAFTLVSRTWYKNHDDIAKAYDRTKSSSFLEVGKEGAPTVDCIFQWLQARYALTKLIAVVPSQQKVGLQQLLSEIDRPGTEHPIIAWSDRWLPSWVRLCWRAGVMQGNDPHTGRRIESWEIPVMPRDVHVPLGTMTGDRRELQAAAKFLVTLGETLSRFKFDMFPGGLWDEKEKCLYLPLPSWGAVSQHSDLSALKPQVGAMRNWGFVRKIRLISLDAANVQPEPALCQQLTAQVRRLIPLANFAKRDALDWVPLEALKGVSNASVD